LANLGEDEEEGIEGEEKTKKLEKFIEKIQSQYKNDPKLQIALAMVVSRGKR
jgi:hypothetical protein